MLRLSEDQISKKINFIENYITSNNAADGSVMDANANVSSKNIAAKKPAARNGPKGICVVIVVSHLPSLE